MKFSLDRNENGEEENGAHFHRVFVYDEGVRDFVKNLQRKDRVLLNGRIGHMTNTQPDGKKLYSGFIVAENVFRIARRTNVEVESNESAQEKAEN